MPGKSHRQRSLVGNSPWGYKESDTTEWLTLSLSKIYWHGLMYNKDMCKECKEYIWINSNEVDETGAYYTEWSKPERKTPIQYAAAAKLLHSCPTLNPRDGSPPGSTVPGILQARTLEWVAISFSNAWKWKVKVKSLSRARLLATPWTAAYQAPPSMGFSRQEYWSGVPLPSLNTVY